MSKVNRIDEENFSFVNKQGEEMDFIADDGGINLDTLEAVFTSVLDDAKKSNNNNGAGGRRFRCNTLALGKVFLELRKVTPVK